MSGHWNYRVTTRMLDTGETEWAVREVYYRADGSVQGWGLDPADVVGEERADLVATMAMIETALTLPVIVIDGEAS